MSLFSRRYHPIHTNMTIANRVKITISPLRLHAASSVRIPTSTHSFLTLLPTVRIRPLNWFSASSVVLHGASNTNVRRNMYPSISKCNAKSCNSCQNFCTNTTFTSSVNGRTFSVINNSDLDSKSENLIYVLT